MIISGFPGVGKSTLGRNPDFKNTVDFDSSNNKTDNFPSDYVDRAILKSVAGETVLVSSHKAVRDALLKRQHPFTLIYPAMDRKEEFLENYRARGNTPEFLTLLDEHWEAWIREIEAIPGTDHLGVVTLVKLEAGQWAEDVYKRT